LITIAIFMTIAGIGIGAYFDYYKSALISEDVDQVLTLIKQTRFRAQKNPTNSDYGVYLDVPTRRLVTFRQSYAPNDPDNRDYQMKRLYFDSLDLLPSLGITNTILFEKQTGKTQNIGTFTLKDNEVEFTYSINAQGIVEMAL
jgi:hypothetical protein